MSTITSQDTAAPVSHQTDEATLRIVAALRALATDTHTPSLDRTHVGLVCAEVFMNGGVPNSTLLGRYVRTLPSRLGIDASPEDRMGGVVQLARHLIHGEPVDSDAVTGITELVCRLLCPDADRDTVARLLTSGDVLPVAVAICSDYQPSLSSALEHVTATGSTSDMLIETVRGILHRLADSCTQRADDTTSIEAAQEHLREACTLRMLRAALTA